MKRLLQSPATNGVCISLFTAFYAWIFFATAQSAAFRGNLAYREIASPWSAWSDFLGTGRHVVLAYVLIGLTVLILALLVTRRQPYDEYHTAILTHCLVVAAVLTLIAIAGFYLMILQDPSGILEKFTLFIVIHWATVVLANLAYVLLCRRN